MKNEDTAACCAKKGRRKTFVSRSLIGLGRIKKNLEGENSSAAGYTRRLVEKGKAAGPEPYTMVML